MGGAISTHLHVAELRQLFAQRVGALLQALQVELHLQTGHRDGLVGPYGGRGHQGQGRRRGQSCKDNSSEVQLVSIYVPLLHRNKSCPKIRI